MELLSLSRSMFSLSVEDRSKNDVSVLSLVKYSIYRCKSGRDLIWLLKIENVTANFTFTLGNIYRERSTVCRNLPRAKETRLLVWV